VGVALGPARAGGERDVMVDGFRFAIPIPEASVGTSYSARGIALTHPKVNDHELPANSAMTLDDGKRVVTVPQPVINLLVQAAPGVTADHRALVALAGKCSALTIALPAGVKPNGRLLDTVGPPVVGGLLGGRELLEAHHGAAAYWPDGRTAGQVDDEATDVLGHERSSSVRGQRCFLLQLRDDLLGDASHHQGDLIVCFAERDVQPVKPRDFGTIGKGRRP
jgi:hypothetical protein